MKKRLTRLLALLLAVVLMLSSCASGAEKNTTQSSSENTSENSDSSGSQTYDESEHKKFLDFTKQQFLDSVASDTVNLHYTLADPKAYGITDYEVSLGSLNKESIEKSYQDMQAVLSELTSFNYAALPAEDQLTYDVLKDYLKTSIEGKNFPYYEDYLTPIMGLHGNLPTVMAEYAFRTERDIEDYLKLLELIPPYLDEVISYEKTRAKKGMVMPSSSIDEVISACQDFIGSTEDNVMISTFNDRIDSFEGLSDSQKTKYKEQNAATVSSQIFPAYEKIILCLKEIKGTGSNLQGICYYPEGKKYYSYLLKSLVGSGHTPEELVSLIEERLDTQMTTMFLLLSKSPELSESFGNYTEENRTPEEILNTLKGKISEDYPALPADVQYQIKYVHESMEASSSPAFYMIPPIDDLKENTIYINKSSTNGGSLFSTLAHEGYPGHLYQTVYASTVLTDPLRHILNFQGYSEGWGLYVEHESYALNDALTSESEDLATLYSLNSSVSLGVHAMLDLKINYEGWNQEQAGEYIETYFGKQDPSNLETIYNTIVSEPAYYLKYYVGYLEILLLREKAEARLESQFSLKEFHKFLLDIGPCSFTTIDDYMETWMENQLAS